MARPARWLYLVGGRPRRLGHPGPDRPLVRATIGGRPSRSRKGRAMSVDPNDPSRRAEEMGEVITPRREDDARRPESDDDVPPNQAITDD